MNSSTNTLPFTSQVHSCAKEHELGAWRSAGPSPFSPCLATLTKDALVSQAMLVYQAQIILCDHLLPDGVSQKETIAALLELFGGAPQMDASLKITRLLAFQA
jgi:hypothetical protein